MEAPSPSSSSSEEVVATQVGVEDGEGLVGTREIAPETTSPPADGATTTSRPSLDEVWESIKHKEEEEKEKHKEEEEKEQEQGEQMSETSPEPVAPVPEVKERARPSSLRTRPSTRAKRNVTFKDDFDERAEANEEKVYRPRRQLQPQQQRQEAPMLLPPACLGLFLALALASLVVYVASPQIPTKPQLWTSAELGKYNGSDNKPPLLLGILGSVFDVSKGWKHYGPGGSYHHFVGRDASRAFVSGNFTDDGLTDSLEGLTPSQIKAIDDWRLFFLSRYVYLGKLVGTFYNSEGAPTKKLHLAEKQVKKAAQIEKQQKLDEETFPNCNSKWTQDEGGEVWCTDGKYPRIIEMATQGPKRGPAPRTRCACLAPEELQGGGGIVAGVQEYDGCDALSSRCKTS